MKYKKIGEICENLISEHREKNKKGTCRPDHDNNNKPCCPLQHCQFASPKTDESENQKCFVPSRPCCHHGHPKTVESENKKMFFGTTPTCCHHEPPKIITRKLIFKKDLCDKIYDAVIQDLCEKRLLDCAEKLKKTLSTPPQPEQIVKKETCESKCTIPKEKNPHQCDKDLLNKNEIELIKKEMEKSKNLSKCDKNIKKDPVINRNKGTIPDKFTGTSIKSSKSEVKNDITKPCCTPPSCFVKALKKEVEKECANKIKFDKTPDGFGIGRIIIELQSFPGGSKGVFEADNRNIQKLLQTPYKGQFCTKQA